MGGAWAPRPSTGPHKLRECLPLILILRNRLKLALNRREVMMICVQRLAQVDGKVRTDPTFLAGFMDVITLGDADKALSKSNDVDRYRVMYDVKGRYQLLKISADEAQFKLCKIKKQAFTRKRIPYVVTHDGRTIRYHDPIVKVNDTVKVDLKTGKIVDTLKFQVGVKVMVTSGKNIGRFGTLVHIERHPGSFNVVNVKDASGKTFATRQQNLFVLSKLDGEIPVTMPKGNGVKLTIFEENQRRLKHVQMVAMKAAATS
jgi:small subunit ribosomal protein S4e